MSNNIRFYRQQIIDKHTNYVSRIKLRKSAIGGGSAPKNDGNNIFQENNGKII